MSTKDGVGLSYECWRQMIWFYEPKLKANFKYGEIVQVQKTVIFSNYYAFRIFYRVNGVKKRGDFKMTDEGVITPVILPKKEWNFGPDELCEY